MNIEKLKIFFDNTKEYEDIEKNVDQEDRT